MTAEVQIKLHRMYVKSSLFETTSITPKLLESAPQLTIDLQIYANTYPQENDVHEVTLTLQVTAKHNGNLIWRINLVKAALYTLQPMEDELKKQVLNGFCVNQIYPHACAAVTQLVTQSGFASVYLQPMDFEQIYREKIQSETKDKTKIIEPV